MKARVLALFLGMALLLTGCGLFDGYYVNVTPYQPQKEGHQSEAVSARNYYQLRTALEELVASGTESSVIYVADYEPQLVESNLEAALTFIREVYPIGAYAVENVAYEVGTSSGKPAIAVDITYRRSQTELRRIQHVKDLEGAESAVAEALKDFDTSLVLLVDNYLNTDFIQLVKDYAEMYPEYVMEVPQVVAEIYGSGSTRVAELNFTYQTSRDSLKQMKSQVLPIFNSAELYVTTNAQDRQKFSQLYSFLMERFDYSLETSITPAYSLLCHGVGDSRAFALTYASMCRRAGLDCRIVTGTRNGEPWTWNMVLDNNYYYHVDLLRSSALGGYRELVDNDMIGYVWDYSAYPECVHPYVPPEETEIMAEVPSVQQPAEPTETEEAPEVTVPEETISVTEETAPEETEQPTEKTE